MSDWIAIHLGMNAYRIFSTLFPIYTPVSWVKAYDYCVFDYIRLPFFIYWPLVAWRRVQIEFLTWAVRNRRDVA